VKNTISLRPLGVIHTPYNEVKGMPIQGIFKPDVVGYVEVFEEYVDCMKGVEMFSHLLLFYYFHKVTEESLIHQPFLEDTNFGVFATRNNKRINKLGISVVRFERLEGNCIHFSEVDILDGTPLLDIKPYVTYFDRREGMHCGWYEKHFQAGKIPERTILKGP
jgi:tRNA-Thr(GGU) m(6)t(6)A37 methyltransferase TsaA